MLSQSNAHEKLKVKSCKKKVKTARNLIFRSFDLMEGLKSQRCDLLSKIHVDDKCAIARMMSKS